MKAKWSAWYAQARHLLDTQYVEVYNQNHYRILEA